MTSDHFARAAALAAIAAAAMLAACGGGGTATGPIVGIANATPTPPSVAPTLAAAAPQALAFSALPTPFPQSTTVIASRFAGTVHVLQTNPQILTVTAVAGQPGSFTVTPSGNGQTSLVFGDGASAAVVPVIVGFCLLPVIAIDGLVFQGVPADGQTGVSVNVGRIYVWQNNFPVPGPFLVLATRLVGSDASVVTGSDLAPSSPPPSIPPGVPGNAQWFTSTIPVLNGATLYQVQLFDSAIACVPQQILGTFST
jgi:hypothetical protein